MKRLIPFFYKNILTNFLAAFLVCLSIADGEEAEHEIIHFDFQVSEVEYDYVDFPVSLIRNNTVSFSSLQRIAEVAFFSVDFRPKSLYLLSEATLNQLSHNLLHPLISNLVKVVICKNAP
jgi:hypothetical protein